MSQQTPTASPVVSLELDTQGRSGRICINRPLKLNALNAEVLEQLERTVAELERTEARVVRVCGAGDKAFVAGADISAMRDMGVQAARAFAAYGGHVFERLAALGALVIAEVQGFALGGGFELALACDVILASDKAKFGLPEVGLGLIPGFGGTQRLTRRIGYGKAIELIATGRTISAEDAHALGIVSKVTTADTLSEQAARLAAEVLAQGGHAVACAKRAVRASQDLPLNAGLGLEATLFSQCFAHHESKEGIAAFLEKRKPQF